MSTNELGAFIFTLSGSNAPNSFVLITGQYSLDRVYQPVMSTNELGAFIFTLSGSNAPNSLVLITG